MSYRIGRKVSVFFLILLIGQYLWALDKVISFNIPSGWSSKPAAHPVLVYAESPAEVNKKDLSDMGDVKNKLNLVELEITDSQLSKLKTEPVASVEKYIANKYPAFNIEKAKVKKIGNLQGVFVEGILPSELYNVKYCVYYFLFNERLFRLTLSAPESSYDGLKEVFKSSVESLAKF